MTTLADLGPVVLPAVLGALAGFIPGVIAGRVDWNQRVSYWRQRAQAKPPTQPPPTAPSPAAQAPAGPPVRLVKPPTTDTRTDAA